MSYLVSSEFFAKMADAGESKILMSTKNTLIRAFMIGSILTLAAVFAMSIAVQIDSLLTGAILFPVGFCVLYLMGFDLLTGFFVLSPLALLDKRSGVTGAGALRNWGFVLLGNVAGTLTALFITALVFIYGFSIEAGDVGQKIISVGEARTLGYPQYAIAAWVMVLYMAYYVTGWSQGKAE